MITKLLLEAKLGFSSEFYTCPKGVGGRWWLGGWVGVENEINANLAFN